MQTTANKRAFYFVATATGRLDDRVFVTENAAREHANNNDLYGNDYTIETVILLTNIGG
jgi:hypothetical protein